jgi:hypothetical protein
MTWCTRKLDPGKSETTKFTKSTKDEAGVAPHPYNGAATQKEEEQWH